MLERLVQDRKKVDCIDMNEKSIKYFTFQAWQADCASGVFLPNCEAKNWSRETGWCAASRMPTVREEAEEPWNESLSDCLVIAVMD